MKPNIEPAAAPAAQKPRFALFLATAFGIGYLPKAPGTWGSIGGIGFTLALVAPFLTRFAQVFRPVWPLLRHIPGSNGDPILYLEVFASILLALIGVWSAERVARHLGSKDPQIVVIDEVSGISVTLLLGLGVSILPSRVVHNPDFVGYGFLFFMRVLNWKYLLAGFILFRVFDIWKPFPVRQAESLPGGWGIMADDWVAAIYAALGLWLLRWMGL
jgi:phosphatidylglycerophosphatase A